MNHLLPIADERELREHGVFYRPGTLRKWFYSQINPQLFRKVRGRLFIDLAAWQDFLERETGAK
jgi:hypothetical protein